MKQGEGLGRERGGVREGVVKRGMGEGVQTPIVLRRKFILACLSHYFLKSHAAPTLSSLLNHLHHYFAPPPQGSPPCTKPDIKAKVRHQSQGHTPRSDIRAKARHQGQTPKPRPDIKVRHQSKARHQGQTSKPRPDNKVRHQSQGQTPRSDTKAKARHQS